VAVDDAGSVVGGIAAEQVLDELDAQRRAPAPQTD
jgi:hypothetical protein